MQMGSGGIQAAVSSGTRKYGIASDIRVWERISCSRYAWPVCCASTMTGADMIKVWMGQKQVFAS